MIAEWLKLRIDDPTRSQYTEEAIQVLRLFVDGGDKKDMSFRDKTETLPDSKCCLAELYGELKEYERAETLFAQAAEKPRARAGSQASMTRSDETHALEHISRMGV